LVPKIFLSLKIKKTAITPNITISKYGKLVCILGNHHQKIYKNILYKKLLKLIFIIMSLSYK
jgi:hypothetical protein